MSKTRHSQKGVEIVYTSRGEIKIICFQKVILSQVVGKSSTFRTVSPPTII